MKFFGLNFNIIYLLLSVIFTVNFGRAINLSDYGQYYGFDDFYGLSNFLMSDMDKIFIENVLEDGIDLLSDKLFDYDIENDLSSFKSNIWFPSKLSTMQIEKAPFYGQISRDDSSRVIVIGDLHGNFNALYKIIDNLIDRDILSRELVIQNDYKIVSLGDYIDRGDESLQTVILLIILKLINPENYIMLRGNHETSEIIDSVVRCIKSENESTMDFMQHYDFVMKYSNFLNLSAPLCEESMKIKDIFCQFFDLLPTVFYLFVKNQIFMFNHAGYAKKKFSNEFLSLNFKYFLISSGGTEFGNTLRKTMLFGDILPTEAFDKKKKQALKHIVETREKLTVIRNKINYYLENSDPRYSENYLLKYLKTVDNKLSILIVNDYFFWDENRGAFSYNDKFVSKKMRSEGITAKFYGHDHFLVKRKLFPDLSWLEAGLTPSSGFMAIGKRKNPIFNIISAEIVQGEFFIKYNPSYFELISNGDIYNVTGNFLNIETNVFESNDVPYYYD